MKTPAMDIIEALGDARENLADAATDAWASSGADEGHVGEPRVLKLSRDINALIERLDKVTSELGWLEEHAAAEAAALDEAEARADAMRY